MRLRKIRRMQGVQTPVNQRGMNTLMKTLKDKGLRPTQPRMAILEALLSGRRHASCAGRPGAAAVRRPRQRTAADGGGTRVLVVDDDPLTVGFVAHVLATHGYEVESVCDGESALAALGRRLPDLVLLDVVMPAMSGIEVLDHIRADPKQSHLPVILITACSADEELLEGYRVGADYYITKPFTAAELLDGIALVVGAARID